MNLQVLKDELTADPLTRGYSGMTDAEAADDLNTAYRESTRRVSNAKYLLWIAGARRKAIGDAAASHGSATVQGLAQVALDLLLRPDIEYDRGDHLALLQALQSGGVLSDTDVAALDDQADATITRAAELGLGTVRAGTVAQARAL